MKGLGFKGLLGALLAFGLLGAPWLLPGWLLFLLTLALAKGLVVLGILVLMWGGLVSFGHGLYFGVGAYTVAFLARLLGVREAALGLLGAALLSGALAGLLGLFFESLSGGIFRDVKRCFFDDPLRLFAKVLLYHRGHRRF